jgi:hypothetical protein
MPVSEAGGSRRGQRFGALLGDHATSTEVFVFGGYIADAGV